MDPTRNIRIAILGITLTLVAIGVVMIYSASAVYAQEQFGDGMYFLKRHLVALALGLVLATVCMWIDYRDIRKWVYPILILIAVGLAMLLIPRLFQAAGGAHRWIPLFGFHLQPSEFAKLGIIFFLAHRVTRDDFDAQDRVKLLKLVGVIAVFGFMILMQPDLGTTASLGMITIVILFVSGISLRYFAVLLGSAGVIFGAAVMLEPYRLRRVTSFLQPWNDIHGAGFQLWQSFLALGSGGFAGVGLGQSQQKLYYLPAAHTDFIFSIIGEELGFLGAAVVIMLYAALVLYGFRVVRRCRSAFGQVLSLGLVTMIAIEALINIGVSVGALPTKGLALPYVSYGGSSLVVKLIAVGLLLNVARDVHTRKQANA